MTEINVLLILNVYLQRADQQQLLFVHLTDIRPWIEMSGYFLFISEIWQMTANTIHTKQKRFNTKPKLVLSPVHYIEPL